MQKSYYESAPWQRPLYGFKISLNQVKIPLKSGVLGRAGGGDWILLCHNETKDCAAEIPLSVISQISYADGTEFIPNNDFEINDYNR